MPDRDGGHLRVCEYGGQQGPDVGAQLDDVHNKVAIAVRQLHEAGDAQEAAEGVVLQIHCQLRSSLQLCHHLPQSLLCVHEVQSSILQPLHNSSTSIQLDCWRGLTTSLPDPSDGNDHRCCNNFCGSHDLLMSYLSNAAKLSRASS